MMKLASITLMGAAVFGPAFAAPADNFDTQVASVLLLQLKPVQRELGVTEQQRAVMNKYADTQRNQVNAYLAQLEKQREKTGQTPKRDDNLLQGYFAVMKKGVLGQLSPVQVKRLREISLQALDFTALADNLVATKVGLSSAQEKKVDSLVKTGIEKANKIRNDAVMDATKDLQKEKPKTQEEQKALYDKARGLAKAAVDKVTPTIVKIRTDTKSKVMAVLTPAERSKWQELQGKPFHLDSPG